MPDSALIDSENRQPQQDKVNLLGFSVSRLGDFFESLGEKSVFVPRKW